MLNPVEARIELLESQVACLFKQLATYQQKCNSFDNQDANSRNDSDKIIFHFDGSTLRGSSSEANIVLDTPREFIVFINSVLFATKRSKKEFCAKLQEPTEWLDENFISLAWENIPRKDVENYFKILTNLLNCTVHTEIKIPSGEISDQVEVENRVNALLARAKQMMQAQEAISAMQTPPTRRKRQAPSQPVDSDISH
ncbi:hypothetical protein Ciccas_012612 [Cichlidogyrus casuarinus]|uniref:Uncharacterized protein n=1 Tax=Cichlidogyrus casuarinus TaxID=1844966 RepID=A0ABD2PMX1_9PLAT